MSSSAFSTPSFRTVHLIFLLILAKLAIHLPFMAEYGFHRDEFLYIALGDHPGWGYWSNPPLIGWLSWLVQHTIGDSIWAIRTLPLLAGCLLIALIVYTCKALGGRMGAQVLAGVAASCTLPMLRAAHMFQPVIFDIFFWALLTYLIVRYLNEQHQRYLLWFGVVLGVGLLNKLSMLFFLFAFIPVLVISSQRKILRLRATWLAAGITAVLALPYLLWQISHDFPVISHMQELRSNQLVNVELGNFLIDQILFNLPALLIWMMGLVYLLRSSSYRILGHFFLAVLLVFILFSGKSYYTLGAYPVLIAAGGVGWENLGKKWISPILILISIGLGYVFLPFSLPVLSVPKMVAFCQDRVDEGIDGPMRWEDGEIHPLPQDYADMLGWEEFAPLVAKAVEQLPENTPYFLYASNYGQAGSIDYYGQAYHLRPCTSFADSYRLWASPETDAEVLIYINDTLGEDVAALFADIELIGTIGNQEAREFGTHVYLCRSPKSSFPDFWRSRYEMVLE